MNNNTLQYQNFVKAINAASQIAVYAKGYSKSENSAATWGILADASFFLLSNEEMLSDYPYPYSCLEIQHRTKGDNAINTESSLCLEDWEYIYTIPTVVSVKVIVDQINVRRESCASDLANEMTFCTNCGVIIECHEHTFIFQVVELGGLVQLHTEYISISSCEKLWQLHYDEPTTQDRNISFVTKLESCSRRYIPIMTVSE